MHCNIKKRLIIKRRQSFIVVPNLDPSPSQSVFTVSLTDQRLVPRDSPTCNPFPNILTCTSTEEASTYSLACTALFDSLWIYQTIDYEKILFRQAIMLDANLRKSRNPEGALLAPGISRGHLLTISLNRLRERMITLGLTKQ